MKNAKKSIVKLLTFILPSILLICCNGQVSTVKDPTIDLKEGKLTYSISGNGTAPGWDLEIFFNEDHAVINERYALGAGVRYIYDKKSNEILGLFDDVSLFRLNKEKYFIYFTQEQLVSIALQSNYGDTNVTVTQEFKDILGYKCQKWIIKHGDQVTVEVWLTDKIKPGIIYPWTPLTFDRVALEYEMKILGKTDRKYVIKSISDEKINSNTFEHIVPDPYYLVVPASEFSLDTMWSKEYQENTFKFFTYPYLDVDRQSTLDYLKDRLYKIIPKNPETTIHIDFNVNKDGTISDINIEVNYSTDDKRIKELKKLIQSMQKWTPAKVKGRPVKSKVLIFA